MEKLILKSLLVISMTLGLAACGAVTTPDITGLDQYTYVSGGFNTANDTTLDGTGVVRFTEVLPGILTGRALKIKAQLDQTIALSSVTAAFYSSSLSLATNNGVFVKFIRSGINVNVEISVNGTTSTVNSSRVTTYFPASLDLVVEVHNEAAKVRVFVWRRDNMIYSATTADIDTERVGDISPALPSSSSGTGQFAGLILQNAVVTAAQMIIPRVQ